MNDRLKQFLTMEGLSPAQFAEILGIQRSGISHLLSGRNNPSYEFIQKMMNAFPDLNFEWLILGKGKPYKGSSEMKNEENSTLPELAEPVSEPSLFADVEAVMQEIKQPEVAENRKIEAPSCNDVQKGARKIERITVYYSDGTYEDR